MDHLKKTVILPATYNSLPYIEEVSHVPGSQANDLEILRVLLAKYRVPESVSIRLIHKHFDLDDGEAMIFKNSAVPEGYVQLMRPIKAAEIENLQAIHYFVDDDGCLQAYEYTTDDVSLPNLSGYEAFLIDFCNTVRERGLQRKFGLKLKNKDESAQTNWTEYEFPQKRSTIMIPEGMPTPEDNSSSYSVITEWSPDQNGLARCSHSVRTCTHCTHCRHQNMNVDVAPDNSMFTLGGQVILPGTSIHHLVAAVIEAW